MRQKLAMVLCIAAAAISFGLAVSVYVTAKFPDARNILDLGIYCTLMAALACLALGLHRGVKKSGRKALRVAPSILIIAALTSFVQLGDASPLAHRVHLLAMAVSVTVALFTLYTVWSQRTGD